MGNPRKCRFIYSGNRIPTTYAWLPWVASDTWRSHSHSQASGVSGVFCKWVVLEQRTGASKKSTPFLTPLEPDFPEPPQTPFWNHPIPLLNLARTSPEPPPNQAQIHKISQIEGFEPWDPSHVKERAKICRKLKSRASGTEMASSYGQITVLRPQI